MSFSMPILDVRNLGLTNSEKMTDSRLAHCSAQFSDLRSLYIGNFAPPISFSGQASMIPASQSDSVGMGMVLTTRNPLKVFDRVVRFISINMVNLMGFRGRISNKVRSHKTVNHKLFTGSEFVEGNPLVPSPYGRFFENKPWGSSTSTPSPTDKAGITNFVRPISNVFPSHNFMVSRHDKYVKGDK